MSASIVVVGGGVIGRTCALELARGGHDVTLVTADPPEATTSAKAAAIWFPFEAYPLDRVLAWGARSLERLAALASEPASGVRLVAGRVIHRAAEPELSWMPAVPGARHVADPAAGDGVRAVTHAVLPCVDMSRHLPWLQREGARCGVREVERRITAIDEALEHGELVVLATGLGTNALVPGAGLRPIQGQVVRVANPGGVEWLLDAEHPDGLLYVIPRVDEVVIGGTEVHGADELEPDPLVERAILERAAAVLPWVADATVTSRAVGLRPARDEVRLEREGDVIHCYGHGGSGVTLAFGCAEEVVALASRSPAQRGGALLS